MSNPSPQAIAAAILFCFSSAALPALASTGNQTDCDVHEPIRILEDKGDDGFVWDDPITGEEVYRPGSGVVAGDGSAENPYVIEGWCISGADWDPPAISISTCDFGANGPNPESTGILVCNTTKHWRLANTTVTLWEHGTGIGNIAPSTGTIEHTDHRNNSYQLHANDAAGLEIRHNLVHGIETTEMIAVSETAIRVTDPNATIAHNKLVGADTLVHIDGDDARIANNVLDASGQFHIDHTGDHAEVVDNTFDYTVFDNAPMYPLAFSGDDALVTNNTITGYAQAGILHLGGTHAEIAENSLSTTEPATGISINGANAWVHNTTINDGATGVSTGGSANSATIENVTVTNASLGLDAYKANATTWRYNDIDGYTHAGMHVDQAENTTVRYTNFEDTNGTALEVENTDTTVDARHNWWGCSEGPEDDGCDDVVGDTIYEPWLIGPNAGAGDGRRAS